MQKQVQMVFICSKNFDWFVFISSIFVIALATTTKTRALSRTAAEANIGTPKPRKRPLRHTNPNDEPNRTGGTGKTFPVPVHSQKAQSDETKSHHQGSATENLPTTSTNALVLFSYVMNFHSHIFPTFLNNFI